MYLGCFHYIVMQCSMTLYLEQMTFYPMGGVYTTAAFQYFS